MVWYADTLWCDGCGVEICWVPTVRGQHSYCCQNCLLGEDCDCDKYQEEYPSNLDNSDINTSQVIHQ